MSLRVLLVDDNLIFITAMRHLLSHIPGVEVVGQAMDGLEGLVTFDQLQPDLVISDLSMPVMNGLELANILRGRPNPPVVIFLSAHNADDYVASVEESGATAFINKADAANGLLPILKSMLSRKEVT